MGFAERRVASRVELKTVSELRNHQDLQRLLLSIDGRGYPAYREMKGEYDFGEYTLSVDHVQADPFAPPSKVRVIMGRREAGIPAELLEGMP